MTVPNDQQKYPFEVLGEAFVKQYYEVFDTNRVALSEMYHPEAMITLEDKKASGKDNIKEILTTSLSFNRIQHVVTKVDCQPTPEQGVMILVTGRLQCDDDPPHAFSQLFCLRPANNSYFIYHDIFRLSLHNL